MLPAAASRRHALQLLCACAQRAAPPRSAAMALALRVVRAALLLPLLPPGGEGRPAVLSKGRSVGVFPSPALLVWGDVCCRSSWFCLKLRYWFVVPAGRLGRGFS